MDNSVRYLTQLSHPYLRINKSLEISTRIYQQSTQFIRNFIRQHDFISANKAYPFQFDLCIAVGEPLHLSRDERKEEYIDHIGDVEKKLRLSNLKYEVIEYVNHLGDRLLQEIPRFTGDINYPHHKRFIVMIDQRHADIKGDQTGLKIFIYEPPENYRNIPYQNPSNWCLNATNNWLLPGIGAASSCNGTLLTLSFHVFEKDKINCHLGWNGRITDCDIEDLKTILPNIFNTESGCIGIENRAFINRTDEDGLNEYIKDMRDYIKPTYEQLLDLCKLQENTIQSLQLENKRLDGLCKKTGATCKDL